MKPTMHVKVPLHTNTDLKKLKRKLVVVLLSIKILPFVSLLELHSGVYPKHLESRGQGQMHIIKTTAYKVVFLIQ